MYGERPFLSEDQSVVGCDHIPKMAEDHKNVRKVNKHSHHCVNVDIRSDFFVIQWP